MTNNLQIIHFPALKIGAIFTVDGEKYTKTSELVFRSAYGMEQYIDPIFDAKLGKEIAGQQAASPQVNTSATIIKDETV